MDYDQFTRFFVGAWWLIFPIALFGLALTRLILRHQARIQALSLLKSYTDRGLTPPDWLIRAIGRYPYC